MVNLKIGSIVKIKSKNGKKSTITDFVYINGIKYAKLKNGTIEPLDNLSLATIKPKKS